MSLSNILQSNNYNIYANSATLTPRTTKPVDSDNVLWLDSNDPGKLFLGDDEIGGDAVKTITAGPGLSATPGITGEVIIGMTNTAVTAGDYTNANISVNSRGQLTAASSGTIYSSSVFTPFFIQNSGPATATYTNDVSSYIRIGTLVIVYTRMRMTTASGGAGAYTFSVSIPITPTLQMFTTLIFPTFLSNLSGGPTFVPNVNSAGTSNIPINVTGLAASTQYILNFSYMYRLSN